MRYNLLPCKHCGRVPVIGRPHDIDIRQIYHFCEKLCVEIRVFPPHEQEMVDFWNAANSENDRKEDNNAITN